MSRPRGEASWPEDAHVFHGASCTWWGSIRETVLSIATEPGRKTLCCPRCRGPVISVPTEAKWWRHVDDYEREGHPGYRAFIAWLRGRCFPTLEHAHAAYMFSVSPVPAIDEAIPSESGAR